MKTESNPERTCDLQWQVESLRFSSLFPTKDPGPVDALWSSITGEEPEKVVVCKSGEQRADGLFRGLGMSLSLRPERVDWLLSQGPDDEDEPFVPNSGGLPDCFDVLKTIASVWTGSDDCPSFHRVALGAVLLAPTESRESGYTALTPYLPAVELAPGESRDFSFQINRPRKSKCLDVEMTINRLSKWSVALFNKGTLVLASGQTRPVLVQSQYACRLELDINTDAEFEGELAPTQIEKVFCESCDLADELAREGDRP